jgi:hypothetical protein
MPPSERKRRNPWAEGRRRSILLVGSTIITLACVVYLWRSLRIFAVIFLVLFTDRMDPQSDPTLAQPATSPR